MLIIAIKKQKQKKSWIKFSHWFLSTSEWKNRQIHWWVKLSAGDWTEDNDCAKYEDHVESHSGMDIDEFGWVPKAADLGYR